MTAGEFFFGPWAGLRLRQDALTDPCDSNLDDYPTDFIKAILRKRFHAAQSHLKSRQSKSITHFDPLRTSLGKPTNAHCDFHAGTPMPHDDH